MKKKDYRELSQLKTFKERYEYLRLKGTIGFQTFGSLRYLNQAFYTSYEWQQVRDFVIVRDNGCDLGIRGRPISGPIIVHHIDPITPDDILNRDPKILDPNNMICTSDSTHKGVHYNQKHIPDDVVERRPGDTIPWNRRS